MQNVKNVVYKSAIYAEGDIHIGDKYVINGQPREIPLQLTHLPFVDKKEVIGRDGDVQEVRKLINDSPKVVLVNGLGGIGRVRLQFDVKLA